MNDKPMQRFYFRLTCETESPSTVATSEFGIEIEVSPGGPRSRSHVATFLWDLAFTPWVPPWNFRWIETMRGVEREASLEAIRTSRKMSLRLLPWKKRIRWATTKREGWVEERLLP